MVQGTTLHYRQIDVRDVDKLNEVIRNISDSQGKLDGLIAAAGIQQETSALEYTQADANMMFEVNITGMGSRNPCDDVKTRLTWWLEQVFS